MREIGATGDPFNTAPLANERHESFVVIFAIAALARAAAVWQSSGTPALLWNGQDLHSFRVLRAAFIVVVLSDGVRKKMLGQAFVVVDSRGVDVDGLGRTAAVEVVRRATRERRRVPPPGTHCKWRRKNRGPTSV